MRTYAAWPFVNNYGQKKFVFHSAVKLNERFLVIVYLLSTKRQARLAWVYTYLD